MSTVELAADESRPLVSPQTRRAARPPLPKIAPGQIWLVELPATANPPAPVRHAIDGADVVIYDRALAQALANALPLGSYAEPAPQDSGDAVAARCVRFARDGWSVVRLVAVRPPQRGRAGRMRDVVDRLVAAGVRPGARVSVWTEATNGACEQEEARLADLAAIVAAQARDTALSVVIDAFGDGSAARLHAVAANGLAG